MPRVLLVVLMALPQIPSPEFMVCLHRDGRVQIEPFEPSCCKGGCEDETPSACPDENCADVPVLESTPQVAPDAAPLDLHAASLALDPPDPIPASKEPELRRPRSFSGPPPPGPEQHLSTVVLRF